jgi:hypothetical protein
MIQCLHDITDSALNPVSGKGYQAVAAFCGKTRGVSYGNGRRFVSKWEAFCGKTRFVLPPRKYPMIIRDANEIDVSFYLHCLMNLWHMCQFFSAKIRLKIE